MFEVSRMFPISLIGVYKEFQVSFKGVAGKLQECFKKDSRVFQVRLK